MVDAEFKTFFKEPPKIKQKKYGVYRKYQRPIKTPKIKKETKRIPKRKWDGDPLLEPYYPGIAKVSPELYKEVIDRADGKCELCGNTNDKLEVHHVVGRKLKAHPANLKVLGEHCCHKPPNGVEGNPEKRYLTLHEYQQWCISNGYNEEETRFLLGGKLVDDWVTGKRIKTIKRTK